MQRTEKWVIMSHPGDYAGIGKKYGISPVLARIMGNRGVDLLSEDEVRDYLSTEPITQYEILASAGTMKDMDRAVKIIREKIEAGKNIRVVGDYDIDGVTASFILIKGLGKAGAVTDHRLPHRIRDGYGLNFNMINEARDENVDTIITCDNGIAAAEEIRLAKEYGMTVIVTDHHEVPFHTEGDERIEDLPEADAVVDPKRPDCNSGFKAICGAYVAYKFILCLYKEMGIDIKEAEEFLEIAAFATIGDVMPLKAENRRLVREGLKRLRHTGNPGLRSLISLSSLEGKELSYYHVGFVLGPCLNAAGRLGDAEDALKLLLSETPDSAHEKAVILKEMNDSRKSITEKGVEKAMEISDSESYENDTVLVIYLPDSHESVAGIVAGKVRERTGKPVFILTDGITSDGEECLKGSGRSIEGFNMFEEMTAVKDIFIKFGGHAMAAGLSLPKDKLPEFRERINKNSSLSKEDLAVKIKIDMELPLSFISFDLIRELQRLEPCGTENEKPVFAARDIIISDMRVLGANRNVLKGRAEDYKGGRVDCVYFGTDAEEVKTFIEDRERAGEGLKILYSPGINEFRGSETLQIIIDGVK